MRACRAFCLYVAMMLASTAGAQQPGLQGFSQVHSQEIAAGVRAGESTYSTETGLRGIEFLTVNLNAPMVSLELVTPLDGPLDSRPVRNLAESVNALSALGLDPRPLAHGTEVLSGLRLSKGALYSWPAGGEPHLLLRSEGGVEIVEPHMRPATLAFDDGTSLTLRSINGSLPVKPGEASVYTGTLRPGQPPMAAWTRSLIASELEPVRRGISLHELFLEHGTLERRLRPSPPKPIDDVSTSRGEALLILPANTPESVLQRLASREPFRVTIPLEPREALASAVLPLKRMLAEGGERIDTAGPEDPIQNAIAINEAGRSVMMLSASRRFRGASTMQAAKLVEFASQEGFPIVAEISGPESMLLTTTDTGVQTVPAANVPVRLLLAVRNVAPTLEIPGTDGELYPVRGVIVEGTRREFPANYARALRDGKTGLTPELNTFWAASFVESPAAGENVLLLLPPRPMRIAALELVHVEAAGFSPEFNLKRFRIDGRETRETNWRPLAEVNHEKPVARERIPIPDAPRLVEIRITILEPGFLKGGNVMRLSELSLWSPEKPIE